MEKTTAQENKQDPLPAKDEIPEMQPEGRLGLFWVFGLLFLCLGWLAPIITLIVLNFKEYIAGASVGCGVQSCNDNPWSGNWGTISEKLDLEDHNILGALQLVAKTLEIWFIFLAGSLVLDLTMLFARRGSGLPIRYLVIPTEFSELRSFFSKTLWTAPNQTTSHTIASPQEDRSWKRILYLFISLVAVVCIIGNLMGPATAVLLLPTLVWREIETPQNQAIFQILVSEPPISSDIISGCSSSEMADGLYSCIGETMENVLDLLLVATDTSANWTLLNKQDLLAFYFNMSGNFLLEFLKGSSQTEAILPLIPIRQTIAFMNNDLIEWAGSGFDDDYADAAEELEPEKLTPYIYNALRNAQHVIVQRQAPGYAFSCDCTVGLSPTFVIRLSEDKEIRCFNFIAEVDFPDTGFNDVDHPLFPLTLVTEDAISTMCIRIGSGWLTNNAYSQFYLGNSSSSRPANVSVYSSDKAIYLNSSTYACATNGITTNTGLCNWDLLFSEDPPSPIIRNASVNPLVTEYITSDNSATSWCVSFTFLRIPTYVLDTSPLSNPFYLVTLSDNGPLTRSDEPIFVHPDWIVAAWTIDKGQTVPNDRQGMTDFLGYVAGSLNNPNYLNDLQSIITAQALSLSGYELKTTSSADKSLSPETSVLRVNLLIYVWSYGLPSRTSKLGVVVAIVGCVIVVLKAVIGIVTRTVPRETLQFVVTALKQDPPIVLKDLNAEEVAKVRFKVRNQDGAKFEI